MAKELESIQLYHEIGSVAGYEKLNRLLYLTRRQQNERVRRGIELIIEKINREDNDGQEKETDTKTKEVR